MASRLAALIHRAQGTLSGLGLLRTMLERGDAGADEPEVQQTLLAGAGHLAALAGELQALSEEHFGPTGGHDVVRAVVQDPQPCGPGGRTDGTTP